jgi:hypothetical protein
MTSRTKKPSVLKVHRLPEGSLKRLKKAFDSAQSDPPPKLELPCEECGSLVAVVRKPRGDWPLRCGDCRHRARLQTKRDTWHRNKELYRLKRTKPNPSNRMGPERAVKGKSAPMKIASAQIGTSNQNGPAIVWTPESGHT